MSGQSYLLAPNQEHRYQLDGASGLYYGRLIAKAEHRAPIDSNLGHGARRCDSYGLAGSIVNWNEVASEAFGWTRAEAVGCLLSDLIIPHRFREAHRRGLEAFLRTGVGPVLRKRIEVTALRKTGEEFPVELSITPYVDDGLLVFLGFLRDITERKRTAARLERQALQAKLLYETVSFAAEAE